VKTQGNLGHLQTKGAIQRAQNLEKWKITMRGNTTIKIINHIVRTMAEVSKSNFRQYGQMEKPEVRRVRQEKSRRGKIREEKE
jgi:hypothetical protein